jgi:hypothetical protein
MKKAFYLLLLCIAIHTLAVAQCSPIAYAGNHNQISPDSAHFPHASQYKPFNTTFQLQLFS